MYVISQLKEPDDLQFIIEIWFNPTCAFGVISLKQISCVCLIEICWLKAYAIAYTGSGLLKNMWSDTNVYGSIRSAVLKNAILALNDLYYNMAEDLAPFTGRTWKFFLRLFFYLQLTGAVVPELLLHAAGDKKFLGSLAVAALEMVPPYLLLWHNILTGIWMF